MGANAGISPTSIVRGTRIAVGARPVALRWYVLQVARARWTRRLEAAEAGAPAVVWADFAAGHLLKLNAVVWFWFIVFDAAGRKKK